MSAQFIYTMHKVGRFHPPDRQVLENISLSFYPGAKIGVLGGNGAGKSSLLKVMAGVDDGFTGDARLTPGFSVGYLEQEPHLDVAKDVRGNVMDGAGETVATLARYEEVLAGWSDPEADYEKLGAEQADLEAKIEASQGWDLQRTIEIAMEALRLPPGDSPVDKLSGGERRRVALCRLLLSQPDLLLLDEPTNHLDAESVGWLERFLSDYEGTVVAITHDRYFLDNVAKWILELDRGRGIPFEGNYSSWLEQKQGRLDSEQRAQAARKRTLERELEWVKMSPRARQSKGRARLTAYESLQAEAEAYDPQEEKVQIHIPPGPRLGDQVIDVANLSKGFDDRLLIEDLSFKLPPAGIVGVIGGNGAGKTTLFNMLISAANDESTGKDSVTQDSVAQDAVTQDAVTQDAVTQDSGTITIGSTVDLAYVDQSRDELDPDRTVYEEIAEGHDLLEIGGREINARAYVGSFNFKGSDQQKRVGVLSGGERNRVHLAKVLKRGGNVLFLDEPTNDLDVDTLRALEDGLDRFPGCAVVISHDRWFLDRIATHILAFEGNSQVRWFEGNFSEYEAFIQRELGTEAGPTPVTYKPLVR